METQKEGVFFTIYSIFLNIILLFYVKKQIQKHKINIYFNTFYLLMDSLNGILFNFSFIYISFISIANHFYITRTR